MLAADAAVTRRTAATGASWRGPGVGGKNRIAGPRTRRRAGSVSQGVAGTTRRHASLPCLDGKFSCLAPRSSPVMSQVSRSAVFGAVEHSKVIPDRLAGVRSAHEPKTRSHTKAPGTPAGRPRCTRTEKNLAKSFPPHASEVRNQTLLLMVTADGTSGRVKNTQRSPAGNSRMNEKRHAAFGEHECPAKLMRNRLGKLLTWRANSDVREPNGRYRKKPYRETRTVARLSYSSYNSNSCPLLS